jgi:AcrR family transcriptional regulator
MKKSGRAAKPPKSRPRGRPRSVVVDRALLEAARDEFAAKGFHAMSMESIAARAGVSKVSLYRRWKSKLAAVADVLSLFGETNVPQDRGSLDADILALIEASTGSNEAKASAKVLMRTMGEISDHPQLRALYRTHLLAPRIAQIRALVERARKRREIRDVPTDIAAAMIGGPLFLHALTLLADPGRKWPNDLARELTRSILLGIAAERPSKSSSSR